MGDTGPCTIKVDMVAAVDSSGHRGMFVVADIEISRDYFRRFKMVECMVDKINQVIA